MGQDTTAQAVALLAVSMLLAAGCSGPTDPGAGVDQTASPTDASQTSTPPTEGGETVTLTLGNALMDMPEQLIVWAAEVRDQTDDAITFEVLSEYGADDAFDDKEQLVLAAVASGDVDLAWVGARALPTFEPLLAPMLVDSHALQEEVFADGIPDRMLEDLALDGVTGLGVLPGPHRRVLGVTRDFRGPDDFSGAVVMSERNATTLRTLDALGAAEPVGGAEAAGLDGLDALIGQVGAVVGNSYQDRAHSFTTNLNLWPRPLVLLANTKALQGLSPEHRQALLDAAGDTLPEQMETARAEDQLPTASRAELCSSPLGLVELTEDDLAAMEEAVEPVLDELREDTTAAGYLDEITALKTELGAPPDAFTCDGDTTASPSPTTRQELCSAGPDLPVLEGPAVGSGPEGPSSTPLAALALCPSDPDDPVWSGMPDALVTGERLALVQLDLSGPPVERCSDTLPGAPSFGLVGLRSDDGSAWRIAPESGCRQWHQISSSFVALAQEALATEPDSDAGQHCSPLTSDKVSSRGQVLSGTYSEVTLCVHPWLSWVAEQAPAYRPVRAHVLEGTELARLGEELSQLETVGPRPVQECPYDSSLVEVRASRSSEEADVRFVSCGLGGYADDGQEQVYWSIFPPQTQAIIERTLHKAATSR